MQESMLGPTSERTDATAQSPISPAPAGWQLVCCDLRFKRGETLGRR